MKKIVFRDSGIEKPGGLTNSVRPPGYFIGGELCINTHPYTFCLLNWRKRHECVPEDRGLKMRIPSILID